MIKQNVQNLPLILYNTLNNKLQPLQYLANSSFKFYCCGPTVYGPAHIGNFRTFLIQDILYRALKILNISISYIRNITDVDDKIILGSQKENTNLKSFTYKWIKQFNLDCKLLGMLSPNCEPKATEHIKEQIIMIKSLIKFGYAYLAKDNSVYYKINAFKNYGKLSSHNFEALAKKAEIINKKLNVENEYHCQIKKDFVLWKAYKSTDGDISWESPWGLGRPGWHIECSAMSAKHLGNTIDLHGGGIDLCFPHHENEIAQNEAITGKIFARHWFHSEHLMIKGRKMSKSLNNLYTLNDLKQKGYDPLTIRYLLISGHYRQSLNFTFEGLFAANSALKKIEKTCSLLIVRSGIDYKYIANWSPSINKIKNWEPFEDCHKALFFDLNTPVALSNLFIALRKINTKKLSRNEAKLILQSLSGILYILGLQRIFKRGKDVKISDITTKLAKQRWNAKIAKDFKKADKIRLELNNAGWKVIDKKNSYELQPNK